MQDETTIHGFCLELQVVCLHTAYKLLLPTVFIISAKVITLTRQQIHSKGF
jgi:hypothetical protein